MANELEKAQLIQEVAELSMQGHKNTAIAQMKGISPGTVQSYINEWEKYVKERAANDPELLDRVLENSIKFIDNYDLMLTNAWEVHEEAKEAGVASARLQALKLIQELTAQKARLFQLLGPRADTNYLEKAKRAERVNEILSDILRTTVADCDRCMPAVWGRLQDAFKMMDKEPEPDFDPEPMEIEALEA